MNKLLAIVTVNEDQATPEVINELNKYVKGLLEEWIQSDDKNVVTFTVMEGITIDVNQMKDEDQPELVKVKVEYAEKPDKLS
jgi:hypothetical protein